MWATGCKLCVGFLFSCVQGGFTPLHLAVLSGHVDIVHILLEASVDVTARDGVSKQHSVMLF
jgi:hypothetical protein